MLDRNYLEQFALSLPEWGAEELTKRKQLLASVKHSLDTATEAFRDHLFLLTLIEGEEARRRRSLTRAAAS